MLETEVNGSVSLSWPSIRATVMQLDDLEFIMEEIEMIIEQLREVNMSSKRQLRNQKKGSNLPAKYFRLSQRLKTLAKITPPLRVHMTRSAAMNSLARNSIARRITPYLILLNRHRESKRKIEFWTAKLEEHRNSWFLWKEKLMKDIPLLNLQKKPVKITCWDDVMGLMRVTELDKGKPLFFRAGHIVGSKWHKFSVSHVHIWWLGVQPKKAVRKLVGGYLSMAEEGECKGAGSGGRIFMVDDDYPFACTEMACIPGNAQRLRYKEEQHLDEEWCSLAIDPQFERGGI